MTTTTTTRTVPGFRPVPGDTRVPYCPAGFELANAEMISRASLRAQMQASRDAAFEIYKLAKKEEADLFALSLQAIGTPDGPAVKERWQQSLERRGQTLERWLAISNTP